MTESIGFAAAACTTFAFVPQSVRVWRTRSAADISLAMYLILVTGVVLWIAYGWLIRSAPLVAANSVSLLFAGSVLAGKLKFRQASVGRDRA